jgi:predicted SAM-dependent methyltransferase
MKIHVTSTALNAGALAKECIESVMEQTLEDWEHHFIDAASIDDTFNQAFTAANDDPRVHLIRNHERRDIFANLLPLWKSFAEDDIIVWLDGDDRLAVDTALEIILEVHKAGAMVTYGQFRWADGRQGTAGRVGPDPRSEHWRATHLKTFRAGLVKHIRDEDLRDPKTGWYSNFVTDQAVMLPLLELVPNHHVFIPRVLHVYNEQHSHMAQRPQDLVLEEERLQQIRSLPRYESLYGHRFHITSRGAWVGPTVHLHHRCSNDLAAWIADYLSKNGSKEDWVYDLGCGVGAYLKTLDSTGFTKCVGIEAEPPQVRQFERVMKFDLTRPLPQAYPSGTVISLEVAEHIPSEFEEIYLDNLTRLCAKTLILSWAVRGQGGDGHVNCRDNHEVIEILGQRGFKFMAEESIAAREAVKDGLFWFKNTVMVFKRMPTSGVIRIPKIIHQIWIGPHERPSALMETWLQQHSDWQYMLWMNELWMNEIDSSFVGERAFKPRTWINQAQIDAMPEWNGKADIMRYEILKTYGGIVIDADSECVRPLDDRFLEDTAFACWENESIRFGLIATGYVGSVPNNPLIDACIKRIASVPLKGRAWECVGPKMFTEVARTFPLRVHPARTFIPTHHTGTEAPGSYPIYAKQYWGSTHGYDTIPKEVSAKKERRLEIGCGPNPMDWTIGDYERNDLNPGPGIDHVGAIQDLEFADSTFIEVYGTGCLEHLTFMQAVKFLKKALHWLRPGGILDVNVPDMMGWVKDAIHETKDEKWIRAAFEGWCRWPGDEHKSFWTEELIVMTLKEVGYTNIDVYQRWAYAGPEDWHICVRARRP